MEAKIVVEFEADELKQFLEILYETTDEGPSGEGWKSNKLEAVIGKLEEAAGIPERDRW